MTGRTQRYRLAGASGGFTLIEVLATLVLVGIVLPVVVDGILLSMATAAYARDQAQASSLADSIMTELVVSGDYQDMEATEQPDPSSPEYHWSAQWVEWESDPLLKQLTVTVTWQRRNQERQITLSTLAYPGSGA